MKFSPLQFPNNPLALGEWFLFSIAIVIVVTAVYVLVLTKTPKPQGETVATNEQRNVETMVSRDPAPALEAASQALQKVDLKSAVEKSVEAVSIILSELLASSGTSDSNLMSISDQAYLVQTRAKSSPQIAQPVYQLNTLRLKAVQNQPIESQEAAWAVSLANWIVSQVKSGQVIV
ncbi:MAG TPA: hypothetical protein VJN71_07315 [Nitrososphaerales archaeon]|nr:hypothetical protein [Nitrososphaerales archaeon]